MLIIVGIVLLVVSLVVLAPRLVNFLSGAESKAPEAACQESVALRASSNIKVAGKNVIKTPLLCKVIDKDISGSKEEVKKELADLMARCWWMYGEGRYENILEGGMALYFPEFKDKNDCSICYSVVVEESEEFPVGDTISSEEFRNYLFNEKYDKIGKKYIEYVQSHGGPGAIQILTDIESQKAYGISFAAKNREPEFLAGAGLGAAGLGVLSVASGPVGWVTGGVLALAGAAFTADNVLTLFTNREVSTVYLTDLDSAQRNCTSGDLEGK